MILRYRNKPAGTWGWQSGWPAWPSLGCGALPLPFTAVERKPLFPQSCGNMAGWLTSSDEQPGPVPLRLGYGLWTWGNFLVWVMSGSSKKMGTLLTVTLQSPTQIWISHLWRRASLKMEDRHEGVPAWPEHVRRAWPLVVGCGHSHTGRQSGKTLWNLAPNLGTKYCGWLVCCCCWLMDAWD